MVYNVVLTTTALLDSIMIVLFFGINLDLRISKRVYYPVFIISVFLFYSLLCYSDCYIKPPDDISILFKYFVFFFAVFVFTMIIFDNKLFIKLITVILFIIVITMANIVSSALYNEMYNKKFYNIIKGGTGLLVCNILCAFFMFFGFSFITAIINRNKINFDSRSIAFLLFTFIIQLVLICSTVYTNCNFHTVGFTIFIVITVMSSIAVDILLFFHMNNTAEIAHQKEQLITALEIQNAENMYYDSVTKKNEEMSKIRHDYIDQLQSIYILIEKDNEASRNKAVAMLQELSGIIQNTVPIAYCKNSSINSLLSVKISDMEKEKIKCSVKADVPQDISIDILEFSRLISNILNNAKTAALKCKSPFVDIAIKYEQNMIIINEKNSTVDKNIKVNEKRYTTKSNKDNHGYGMSIIKEIAHKHNGNVICETKNGVFSIIVLCQLN